VQISFYKLISKDRVGLLTFLNRNKSYASYVNFEGFIVFSAVPTHLLPLLFSPNTFLNEEKRGRLTFLGSQRNTQTNSL